MKRNLLKGLGLLAMSAAMVGISSCESVELNSHTNGGNEDVTTRAWFNIAMGTDVSGSTGATYVQALSDVTSGTVSFKGHGFEVPCTRTARIFASEVGKILYSLDYGGGTISKYDVNGGQSYTLDTRINVSYAIGTENPRWTKLTDQYAMVQHATTSHQMNADNTYNYTKALIYLVSLDLGEMSMNSIEQFDMPRSAEDDEKSLHVWRIDAPVVQGGKAYVGLNKRSYDPTTASNVSTSDYSASTLVVDYPSLTNPKIISSTNGKGSTQGYRTPVAHADEKGDIYQITAAPSKMLKISNGDYDNSYVMDLSALLGVEIGSNGWFYVGNGIGYLPYYDKALGNSAAAGAWSVARIDLYNKSVVKLNVPQNLWLQQYQYSITGEDGKFYMALAPVTGEGHIYMFDPTSTSADGFEKGATLPALDSDCTYIGIF